METPFGVWLPQVTILRTRSLSAAQGAVEAIRQRHCVLLQLDVATPEEAQRIVDFLTGAINALDGQVERIGGVHLFVRFSRRQRQPRLNRSVHHPACGALEQAQSSSLDPQRLARLEAILTGVPGDRELRLVLEQLDPGAGGTFTWLDQRNASLAFMPGTASVPVQVLLELKGRGELLVLLTSREGMGTGAPLSRSVHEQILQRLAQLLPESVLQYRSDRDGPLEPVATSR